MALRRQVIDFIRPDAVDHIGQVAGIGQVAIMQVKIDRFAIGAVRIVVEVIDALGVERAGAADKPVHFIALGEQQFRQVGAVLAGDSGN